jgi:hypothetical protein
MDENEFNIIEVLRFGGMIGGCCKFGEKLWRTVWNLAKNIWRMDDHSWSMDFFLEEGPYSSKNLGELWCFSENSSDLWNFLEEYLEEGVYSSGRVPKPRAL